MKWAINGITSVFIIGKLPLYKEIAERTDVCMKMIKKIIMSVLDIILALFVYPAAFFFKVIRKMGIHRVPVCKRVLLQVGVFPILDHYYEPFFNGKMLNKPLSQDRVLPGIDWNIREQLAVLDSFHYNEEMKDVSVSKNDEFTFYMNNMTFGPGDAEYLYNIIRLKKPLRIFEIGSGNSTLMALRATRKNEKEIPGYRCKHICIEPYEMPRLEKSGVQVIRQKVEDIDGSFFAELGKDDILFIDSSHVIRPQGDVLFEYLELMPSLNSSVIVHIHDIFSPRDYKEEWVIDEVRLWNEQYLLEAFLTSNKEWKIIGALNYLHHHHYERLREKCPFLTRTKEPGSFYIQKVS